MSERRARSGSPTEMTDSKRRATVTEPVEVFTFCEDGDTSSPIDKHFSIFERHYSPIYNLFKSHYGAKLMAAKILENQFDVLAIAKPPMEAFLKSVDKGVPISDEDAKNLLRVVWLHPCFVQSFEAAILDDKRMYNSVMFYAREDSPADRVARMEADPNFKPSVMGLKEPVSRSTFLRLFLAILIGHWGGYEDVLRLLDQKMGKNVFGRRLDTIAMNRAISIMRNGKKDEIEKFSYRVNGINVISREKVMEPLRKLMVERYGQREDRDIEAILEKTGLYDLIIMTCRPLRYGGTVEISVTVINGQNSLISMEKIE